MKKSLKLSKIARIWKNYSVSRWQTHTPFQTVTLVIASQIKSNQECSTVSDLNITENFRCDLTWNFQLDFEASWFELKIFQAPTLPFALSFPSTSQKIKFMFHVFPVPCYCLLISLCASFIACILRHNFWIFERKNSNRALWDDSQLVLLGALLFRIPKSVQG